MKNSWNKILVAFCLIFLLSATVFFQQRNAVKISTEAEIKSDIELAPCEDDARIEEVKNLFKKMGATNEDLKVEEFKSVENLVVTTEGKTDETVIIGAHYDKVSDGCGAIDNWTGIVILTNLYRTIKDLDTNKTYKFVAFGKEEDGLIGSKAMAKAIPEEDREKYCAMLNFDSFGFSYPQAMGNTSDKSLIDLAKMTAKDFDFPFDDNSINGANADSTSFKAVKIPVITLHGLSGDFRDFLHTSKDKQKYVNSSSVYIGYRFGLNLLAKIDLSGCSSFRD